MGVATPATNPGFNPRTRKGCDEYNDVLAGLEKVSIHAPVKDATYIVFL